MLLEISDHLVGRAETNASELVVLLAIQLYADNRIDHADACRLARLSPAEFNRELLHRHIVVQEYPKWSRPAV